MKASRILIFAAVATVAFTSIILPSRAQGVGNATVPQGASSVYAIRNARIVTVSGPEIENGTIVVRDGRIEAVGAGLQVPAGAQEIDARGLTVYPGMIDLGTSMGLVEISGGAAGTVDLSEVGDMNPNARAILAVNPHSEHVGVTRVGGVTSVLSMPQGGLVSGQAAFINLNGTTAREMALVESAALVLNFPRISATGGEFGWARAQQPANVAEAARLRDQRIEQIRRSLRDAEAYGRAQDAYARDNSLPRPDQDVVLASLVPFVRGERPVILRADREIEIRAAVRFAEEMRMRPIIIGGNDAWKAASFLRERNVPVILTGVLELPMRDDDAYDTLYENAARLQQAGVRFCISTGDSGAHARDLPFHAGMAAAYGLPRAEALRAVTLYPAQIMGVADRLGSIEAGKIANLVIVGGDILDARSEIRYVFIGGQQIPLTSRHTELYEQFRNRR